jgi:transcriptional regulator with XRE-family HTH domain
MTQTELGLRIAQSQSVISRWERRRLEPTIEDLLAAASALGIGVGDLLDNGLQGPGRRRSRRGMLADDRSSIGRRLRLLREEAGLDPYAAARAARIPPRRLRHIEDGASPGLDEVDRLLTAIGAASSSLVSGNLDKPMGPPNVTPDLRPE